MMTRFRDRKTTIGATCRVWAGIAAVLVVGGLVDAQERGRCVTVDVPATFVTHARVAHEPGALRLCVDRIHSPVSVLHTVYVDGYPVAMLQSRTGRSESRAGRQPYVQFRRNDRGQLVLVGYAWPDGDRMRTHILANGDELRSSGAGTANAVVEEAEESFVLAAARAD